MAELSTARKSRTHLSTRKGGARRAIPRSHFMNDLGKALRQELSQQGIPADVQIESVPTTKLFRVMITAKKFKHLEHAERQSLVWRIVDRHFTPEQQLQISMIVTLTPQELEG